VGHEYGLPFCHACIVPSIVNSVLFEVWITKSFVLKQNNN